MMSSKKYVIAIIIILFSLKSYSNTVKLDVVYSESQSDQFSRLKKDLEYANSLYKKCHVQFEIQNIVKAPQQSSIDEWETFWFNGNGKLSVWEQGFNELKKHNKVILLVDSINWTQNGFGTWAVGYAPFLKASGYLNSSEFTYFEEYLEGSVVLGKYRAQYTLAHELGHALFDFEHTNEYKNLMANRKYGNEITFKDGELTIYEYSELSISQCEKIKKTFNN